MAPGGQEVPGDPAIEDSEIEREHRGMRRPDRARGEPVGHLAARGALRVGGEHRIHRGRPERKRMRPALQVLSPAAHLVLAARPARARLVPSGPFRAPNRLPQLLKRAKQRTGHRVVVTEGRRQLIRARPVPRAQLILHRIAHRRHMTRCHPQAGANQQPGLVAAPAPLRRSGLQQLPDPRAALRVNGHDARQPRMPGSAGRGQFHRVCDQADHVRTRQPRPRERNAVCQRRHAAQRERSGIEADRTAGTELPLGQQPLRDT